MVRAGVSWGSCHTSREMFQIMLFIRCDSVVPFVGESKRNWVHSLLSNSTLMKRSDRPLMFVQIFRRDSPADFPVREVSFVPAGWFARHVPLHKLQVAGIKHALQICGDALSTQQTYGCVTVDS